MTAKKDTPHNNHDLLESILERVESIDKNVEDILDHFDDAKYLPWYDGHYSGDNCYKWFWLPSSGAATHPSSAPMGLHRFGHRWNHNRVAVRPGIIALTDNLYSKLLGQCPGKPFQLAFKWICFHKSFPFCDAISWGHIHHIANSGCKPLLNSHLWAVLLAAHS